MTWKQFSFPKQHTISISVQWWVSKYLKQIIDNTKRRNDSVVENISALQYNINEIKQRNRRVNIVTQNIKYAYIFTILDGGWIFGQPVWLFEQFSSKITTFLIHNLTHNNKLKFPSVLSRTLTGQTLFVLRVHFQKLAFTHFMEHDFEKH